MNSPGEIVICGLTSQGKTFRPSDWAERLASLASHMGLDNRLNYCPCVQPVLRGGVRCVVLSRALENEAPETYKFLMDFARDNQLVVNLGRSGLRDPGLRE
ncbi:MAG: DUF3579 domain-containing protein [Betaproteobacteria bacterium]|nr:DUF3579 domain-containing protein [Betaproteobacteria bacterium]